MARIASLDAAEATDRMTNALRGFNMEINESNADNIADVYSKLAAISASDVDEISTAMTKVASLANSANMSFENTAAFLSQIIETTRESAETAGTALKTVIARFSEVKELYSKGELLGETEEGEEIDVNKVSQALRTAGINLNEFLTGQKGLDAIFMELASKWDDLDIV
jgi:TP901 family phage tail tape measure protein